MEQVLLVVATGQELLLHAVVDVGQVVSVLPGVLLQLRWEGPVAGM